MHIPIERAMELLAQRGLPLRPQSAAQPQNEAQKNQAAKTEKKGKQQ
jgi:hypothetical protein